MSDSFSERPPKNIEAIRQAIIDGTLDAETMHRTLLTEMNHAYDLLGQLIRANDPHDTTAGSSGTTWVYAYDLGGNILSKTAYAYTTGTVGAAVRTDSFTYGDANWKDKLTAYNGAAISYDTISNPVSDGTWTYTWAKGRQLQSMSKSGETVSFTYNEDGLRV